MNKTREIVFTYILIFLAQVVINEFLNIGSYLYLCLIPLAIIVLPIGMPTWKMMLYGFALGLVIDATTDGVLGLNASAAVLLSSLRDIFYSLLVNKEQSDKARVIQLKNISIGKFAGYVITCILSFLIVYILLDGIQLRSFGFFISKLLVSLIVNAIVTIAVCYLVLNRRID